MAEDLIGIIGGTGLGDALAEHIEHADKDQGWIHKSLVW